MLHLKVSQNVSESRAVRIPAQKIIGAILSKGTYLLMTSIQKNTFFSSITLGVRFLSNALLFILMGRALGASEFGKFGFAIAFTVLFILLVDYGFNLFIVKEIAVSPAKITQLSGDIVDAKILLSIISTALLTVTLKFLRYPFETELIVYVLWAAAIFYSFGLFFNTLFRGLNQFQYETYPTILLNGIQFVLICVLLLLKFKTLSIAAAYLCARVIYFGVSLYLVHKKIGRLSLSFRFSKSLKLLMDSLPFGVHAILGTVYLQLDTVFLSYFRGNAEVGYYQAAMRVVFATMVIYDIVISSYFPVIAQKFKTDVIEFKKYGMTLNKYMLLTGGAVSVFLLIYSGPIIKALYGGEYFPSIVIMQLLTAVIFLRFLGGSYATFMTVADNQKLRAYAAAASVIINIVLNLYLIPRYGAFGAAIASIVTHGVLTVIYFVLAAKLIKDTFIDRSCYKGIAILIFSGSMTALSLRFFGMGSSLVVFFLTVPLILPLMLHDMNIPKPVLHKFINRS